MLDLKYYCDNKRHLVCIPYSVENLHRMAKELDIRDCWFHFKKGTRSHYDLPKGRIKEIQAKCTIVNRRDIIRIIKGEYVES